MKRISAPHTVDKPRFQRAVQTTLRAALKRSSSALSSPIHVSKEGSIKPWCDQLKRQLFEAEYLADEDSVFVPARLLTNSENNFITLTETTLNGIYTCR